MMNNVQGDCRCGALGFPAGEDLTLATGKLAKLNADGHVVLPTAAADITPYVITCGADQGYLCGVTPLNSLSNARVILKGACQAGQLLVAVGDGRVEAGTLSGTAIPVGVAEEDGVDRQHVLLRPLCVGARGAAGAVGADGAAGADGAPGAAGPQGETGMDGGAFHVPVSLIANAPSGNDLVGLVLAVFPGPSFDVLADNGGAIAWIVVSGLTELGGTAYAVCWRLWPTSAADNTQVVIPASVVDPGDLTTEIRVVHVGESGYCRLSRDSSAQMMGSTMLKVGAVAGLKIFGLTFYNV